MWECVCDCGNSKEVRLSHLTTKRIRSCGCYRSSEEVRRKWVRHGLIKTREYRIWMLMLQRCNNPRSTSYRFYGAKGIRVCERWHSFEAFLADVGPCPSPLHTLDRENPLGHYEPGNVRWATKKEQARNTRSNVFYEIAGQRRCIAEWCEIGGVPYARAYARLNMGWPAAQAFGLEPRRC